MSSIGALLHIVSINHYLFLDHKYPEVTYIFWKFSETEVTWGNIFRFQKIFFFYERENSR